MEKKFFIQENGLISKAYSIDDLRTKDLTSSTLVCIKFGDWKEAKDIPEIAEILEWQPKPPNEVDWSPSPPPINTSKQQLFHQSTQTNQPIQPFQQTIIIAGLNRKSTGLAFVLALFFGPLGLLYSTVTGGIIMFFVSLFIGLVTFGFGLIIGWIICIIWAMIAVNSYNAKLSHSSIVSNQQRQPHQQTNTHYSNNHPMVSPKAETQVKHELEIESNISTQDPFLKVAEISDDKTSFIQTNNLSDRKSDSENLKKVNENLLSKNKMLLITGSFIFIAGLVSYFLFLNKNDSTNVAMVNTLQSLAKTNEIKSNETKIQSTPIVYVKTNDGSTLRLRTQPSEMAPVIAKIPNGTSLNINSYSEQYDNVNGEKGKWCNVTYNGVKGWAWGGFLKNKIDGETAETNNLVEEINAKLASTHNSKYRVVTDIDKNWSKYDFDNIISPERNKFQYFPYIVKGDFNGDGISDLAAQIKNIENNFERLVFIFGGNNETKFYDGQLCSGISFIPANEWKSHWEKGSLKLNADAIIVSCFESSAWILYWDGNSLKEYWMSD
jgi:hypothetical protein